MSRNVKRRLLPPKGRREDETTPIVETPQQTFARKLYHALLDKGMSQSDLAHKVWGEYRVDARGYETVVGRDRISSWVNGKSLPEPHNLVKVAKALGMSPDELAPNLTASAIERETPEVAITAIAAHPDKVLLKVNKIVSFNTATKIMALINEENK